MSAPERSLAKRMEDARWTFDEAIARIAELEQELRDQEFGHQQAEAQLGQQVERLQELLDEHGVKHGSYVG